MTTESESTNCSCTDGRLTASVALLVTVAGCAGESTGSTETPADLPRAGYTVRLDSERSDPGQFELSEEAGEIHILTGPAGIAYRGDDEVTRGDFRVEATFVQTGAPVGYREAYGVFVGGRDLQGPEQEYTYFLVRPTGEYLVKRRLSDLTEVIVDWSASDAVASVEAEGDEPRNTLAVEVVEGQTRFLVNGALVHAMPAPEARPYGITGIRANHRLDITVSGWELGPLTGDP